MPATFDNPETPQSKPKLSPLTIAIGIVAAAAILLSLWFLFEPLQNRPTIALQQSVNLKMNPAEQQYAKNIDIGNIAMTRAENFLHQEVTTMTGEVHNAGNQQVVALSLTAEFFDDMNQVVLRETRPVLLNPRVPLAPGDRRAFEISFDHVPTSWNMQAPTVRVARLQLPAQKQ